MGKKKILMYQTHIAYITNELMIDFDEYHPVINFSAWIRAQAEKDFDLRISSKMHLDLLDNLVVHNHYQDKAEWLREKMRLAIKSAKEIPVE